MSNENVIENRGLVSPGLLKVGIGLGVAVLIVKTTPIMDILQLFFTVVLIPMALLASFGLIGSGTYNIFVDHTIGWVKRLKSQVRNNLDQMRNDDVYNSTEHVTQAQRAPQPAPATV